MKVDEILAALTAMFPDAHCELNHRNPFELGGRRRAVRADNRRVCQ